MKQIFLVLITITVFTLSSCRKSNINDYEVDTAAVQQVFNNSNEGLQRSMFRLLNPAEKSATWKMKYQDLLNNPGLSTEQSNFIKSLIMYVSNSEIFSKAYQRNSLKSKEDEFKAKAIALFGKNDAYFILASLQNQNVSNSNEPALPNCSCSQSSDWCAIPSTDCKASAWCKDLTSGCGTFWSYSCNGLCRDSTLP